MKEIIKATSGGKLYIETKDFFNQPKVQEIVKKGIKLANKLKLEDVRSIKKY